MGYIYPIDLNYGHHFEEKDLLMSVSKSDKEGYQITVKVLL